MGRDFPPTLRIWDPAPGKERHVLKGHTGDINDCAVSPDGSFVVSANSDKTLRIWDPASGKERHVLVGHAERVRACTVSPDGSFVVSASPKMVRIWDSALWKEHHVLEGGYMGEGVAPAFAVSPIAANG